MKKEEEFLTQLIKTVKLDTLSSGFTDDIMDFLKMEEQFLSDKGSILHQKLDRSLIPSTSDDFTGRVIIALEEKNATSLFKPLISRKNWIAIFSVFVLSSLFFMIKDAALEVVYISERTMNQIAWFIELFTIPSVLSISVLAFLSLLLLDVFLRQEKSIR